MWIAVVLLFAILLLLFYLDTVKPKNYPPGPSWLPILGSAIEIARLRKSKGALCLAIDHLSKTYGPLIGLKIGQERIVIAYGGDIIREFLATESLNGRPTGAFYEIRTFGRKGILLTDEDFWAEQRRFILRHLREFGFGKRDMSALIEEEAIVMIDYFKNKIAASKDPLILQMNSSFGIHVLNTLWSMLAGVRYSPDDKTLKHLQGMLNELFKSIDMMGTLFSHFPLLRYVAPEYSGYNLYVKTHIPIWDFIRKEIQHHKLTHDPENPRDMIDMYLTMLNSPDKPESFTEEQLLAICLDMFMAGSETTTKSLSFGLLYLVLNPTVQRRAQEEIDTVVGRNRLPSLSDRPNMPYMEGLVLETVRHFMARTFGVPHRALKDTHLGGYFIPKGTMLIQNSYRVFIGEESIWEDPEAFRPDRFIENGKVKINDYYLPFGMGKRRCLGETLAKANLFIFISAMLQSFNFELPEGIAKPSTATVDGVTASPVPFKGVLTLRD